MKLSKVLRHLRPRFLLFLSKRIGYLKTTGLGIIVALGVALGGGAVIQIVSQNQVSRDNASQPSSLCFN